MKKLIYISTIIIISSLIISCDKNDNDNVTNELSNETITIDDSSAFNMNNFVTSFEQMFVSSMRWAWDFSHDINGEGEALTTYQNIKIFGKYGKHIFEITHNYNDEEVIISSYREALTSALHGSNTLEFQYDYDEEGFITKLTKIQEGEVVDIVEMKYNENNQLVSKTHLETKSNNKRISFNNTLKRYGHQHIINSHSNVIKSTESSMEFFTYNNDGLVSSYTSDYDDDNYQWSEEYYYSDGKMVKIKGYDDGNLEGTETLEYNNNLLTKREWEDGYKTWDYENNLMIMKYYNEGYLEGKREIEEGFNTIKNWNYYYEENIFTYCRAQEYDDNGFTDKNEYYEGSVDALILIGYTEIDSRDPNRNNKKLKESVYEAGGSKLYYAEFSLAEGDYGWYIEETNWFTADDMSISQEDISEEWVFILVR